MTNLKMYGYGLEQLEYHMANCHKHGPKMHKKCPGLAIYYLFEICEFVAVLSLAFFSLRLLRLKANKDVTLILNSG